MADRWLAAYTENFPTYKEAARLAEQELSNALTGRLISIHSIRARAKSPASAAAKVKRKGYGRPAQQMTDTIGARVITSYSAGIEAVVDRLRARFAIDDKNSVDKRRVLSTSEFGYRSVHLVLTIGKTGSLGPAAAILSRTKLEVQVRSIIEHAWAEAEHALRYKSGVDLPDAVKRRFNALAGALEIVDSEFDALARSLVDLVDKYRERYLSGELTDDDMDSARLLGYMSAMCPDAVPLGPRPLLLPFQGAAECVRVLARAGIRNAIQLTDAMQGDSFRALVRNYADERNVEPEEVSVAVRVGAIVTLVDASILSDHPDLNDSVLRNLAQQP